MTISEEKRRIRKETRAMESALTEDYLLRAGAAIRAGLAALPEYASAKTIFCFAGVGREPDTIPFLAQAIQEGKQVCLPRCIAPGLMELRQINNIRQLSPGAYSIPEPPSSAPLLTHQEIDLAVIPCLCCDHTGNRLGKGGGFYDRFLAQYDGFAVLVCLEQLILPHIPMDIHDRPVPCVVTEQSVYRHKNSEKK